MSHLANLISDLTPRELEILEQASFGGTNAQVANVLGVVEHTVKFHMSAVFEKLGVASRCELVSLYWQSALRDAEQDREDALSADYRCAKCPLREGCAEIGRCPARESA